MTSKAVEVAARAAHEVNRAITEANGDKPQPHWEDAPGYMRSESRHGVEQVVRTGRSSHESWVAKKRRDGWTYGRREDPKRKEHPDMVPASKLPPAEKAKDEAFTAVAKATFEAVKQAGCRVPPQYLSTPRSRNGGKLPKQSKAARKRSLEKGAEHTHENTLRDRAMKVTFQHGGKWIALGDREKCYPRFDSFEEALAESTRNLERRDRRTIEDAIVSMGRDRFDQLAKQAGLRDVLLVPGGVPVFHRMTLSTLAALLEKRAEYDGRRGPKWPKLKKGRTTLDPEERAEVMARKAVWHHGPNGEETPAVWKSIVDGKAWYVTNTHRAMNIAPTLKGAINRYHRFIKGTA